MDFRLFWGFLIMLWGFQIIFEALFGIELPFIQTGIGLSLIYVGLRMLSCK